jgi:hypothetical protein
MSKHKQLFWFEEILCFQDLSYCKILRQGFFKILTPCRHNITFLELPVSHINIVIKIDKDQMLKETNRHNSFNNNTWA